NRTGDKQSRLKALDDLAATYIEMARYADAERTWRQALAAAERLWGPKSATTARALWNLGTTYHQTGRKDDADLCFPRFEAIGSLDLTSDPVVAAENMGYLGLIYIGRHRPEKAIAAFAQAVETLEKVPNFSKAQESQILIESAAALGDAGRFGD